MSRTKAFISILIILILIALSGVSVWAAPGGQTEEPTAEPTEEPTAEPTEEPTAEPTEEPTAEPTEEPTAEPTEEPTVISGEVQEIVIEVDEETGTTTVLVTLLVDETTGQTQTVRLSLETAIALGLVGEDAEGEPIANEDMIGKTVEIDPSDVIEEGEEEGEEGWHPVASALAEFFAPILGLDYETVMGYHEDGMGFGVIAQACWMSYALEGDAELLDDILEAKKSHNFGSIELSEGETATNWGQFKKAVLGSEKAKKNLGAIMSGRAAGEQEQEEEEEEDVVVGSSTELSGKGKDKGGKPDMPPGKVKDKDKGGGPPAEPPGKVKNKDKGKGGGKEK